MPDPLVAMPVRLTAGETAQWYQAVADVELAPGGAYTLRVYLNGASKCTLTASDDDGQWLVTLPASTSGGLAAGTYQWHAFAEQGTGDAVERVPVASGVLDVRPNPVTAAAGELVSHATRALAMVEAVIEGRITDDVESYTIGNRQVTTMSIRELTQLRGIYAAQVARERSGGRGIRTHRAVFHGR